MNLFITGQESHHFSRIKYLRGALIREGHLVRVSKNGALPPRDADLWFHGVSTLSDLPFPEHYVDPMLAFAGELLLFQNDDGSQILMDQIPEVLIPKTRLFLRNQWTRERPLPAVIRNRTGLINPILDPLRPHPGRPLVARLLQAAFYGARTGLKNLPSGENSREVALRLLKGGKIAIEGGLIEHPTYGPLPEDLTVPLISKRAHRQSLDRSVICLCPWGNSPLTYRLFEGFAHRNLVLAQSIAGIRFADCGLKAGVHYVEVARDLSNLVEEARYYLDHLDEAQAIADAGHELFKSNFAFRGIALPAPLFEQVRATWQGVLDPVSRPGWRRRFARFLTPFVSNLPSL